jgi:hypothetical protein
LSAVTHPDVFRLAPQAKAGAEPLEARRLLEHILLIGQQSVLVGEYRTAGRLPGEEGAAADKRDLRLEALRRSVDAGEGRLGAGLSDDGEDY